MLRLAGNRKWQQTMCDLEPLTVVFNAREDSPRPASTLVHQQDPCRGGSAGGMKPFCPLYVHRVWGVESRCAKNGALTLRALFSCRLYVGLMSECRFRA